MLQNQNKDSVASRRHLYIQENGMQINKFFEISKIWNIYDDLKHLHCYACVIFEWVLLNRLNWSGSNELIIRINEK